ncbi:MAG: TetR/AcrR family transcriptional regulator [Desulforegulaceae bacterium]|nr:TetR/AcrR family transcriptional regulator [Desulforegulaceae bacterium]
MKKEPPGKIKIKNSLKNLLNTKDFDSITTAETASNAGVTEALIYKYFKDKQNLLYEVVEEMFEDVNSYIQEKVDVEKSPEDKLKAFIFSSIDTYSRERVFAKIILIEVRRMPAFFQSLPYQSVRNYSKMLFDILSLGIEKGVFKKEPGTKVLRDMILGSIEHTCLWGIIFSKEIDAFQITSQIFSTILYGIKA